MKDQTGTDPFALQDLDKDDYIPAPFQPASPAEVHQLTIRKAEERKERERKKQRKLGEHGFEVEHSGEVLF